VTDRADLRHRSIPGMARDSAQAYGSQPAIIDGASTLTFADVADQMHRVAAALIASGTQPGDRIGVWAPNSAAWVPAALGIMAAGAWLVPLNTRYKGEEAAYILGKADASALFVADGFMDTGYLDMLTAADAGLRALRQAVRLPLPGEYARGDWLDFLSQGDAATLSQASDRVDRLSPHDVCDLIFTSGTTGIPKGVMLRHDASLRGYAELNQGLGLRAGDVNLVANPFFHCFGYKAGWMLDLMVGATTVPLAVFNARTAMSLIQRHGVTHMPGSPTMFWSILNDAGRSGYDLSSLRVTLVAAASIPAELVGHMRTDFALDVVMTGYGLTENHALGAFTRPADPPERVSTTVGRMAPGLEARIVADDGTVLPAGSPGELQIRGYSHMTGYYDDPAGTAAVLHDGWLDTGDVGVLDADGFLSITDRKKDIFVMGGFNVAPAEVERVLLRMPAVAEVAVIGTPDPRFGEVGAAFLVPAPGARVVPDDVLAFAREHLANFKVPRFVEVVDELPHNATGKVVKEALRTRPLTLPAAKSVVRDEGACRG
jgi:HIP---CoA ligase